MNTDIQVIEKALVEFNVVAASLEQLKKNYAGQLFEVDTANGLEYAKAARAVIRKPRYEIERIRKATKAPLLALGKQLDAEAARITAELLKLEDPIDQQIKNEEGRKEREEKARAEAEQKRIEDIQKKLTAMRSVVDVCMRWDCAAATIADHIATIERIVIDDSFAEFRATAEDTKKATLTKLQEAHAAVLAREEEQRRAAATQAELERLRTENAAREAKERAEREERERQERLKREAEEKAAKEKREAEERAASAKLAAEHAELVRQQVAEQERIAAENKKLAEERAAFEREQAEARRKAEAEEAKKRAEAEAERKSKEEAERLTKKAKYPGEKAILDAITQHFGVSEVVARNWLIELRKVA